MTPAIAHHELEDGYDPLGLLLNDDDAKGILDALACLDDCHPTGSKPSVGLLQDGVTYGPVPTASKSVPSSGSAGQSEKVQAFGPAPPPAQAAPSQAPQQQQEMKKPCHPYFYYRDFSGLPDPDPSTPITAPGRIPNFSSKLYAILSRKDLADIVTWLPHGRSWKILKPREFEVKVIPTYFEHSKFSSFIRQANGWGFRRIISKGPDRNSYYHELFLRGRPHLLKLMRRPPPSSKPLADASTEPDFHAISQERPLPEIKEGDAATDALARGNFPRQATYSFVPPASYTPPTSTKSAPMPSPTAAPTPYNSHPPQPANHAPAPAPYSNGYHNTAPHHEGPVYHAPPAASQPQQQHYHYPPAPPVAPAPVAPVAPPQPDTSTSKNYSIHPVESTESLLDLLNKPLPEPEMFGSHTFYPLMD